MLSRVKVKSKRKPENKVELIKKWSPPKFWLYAN
jgi:hypothetical protein